MQLDTPEQVIALTIGAVWFGASVGLFKFSWDRLSELKPSPSETKYDGWDDEESGY